jgi:hypothetical protein
MSEEIKQLITELDTAVGMLIVPAMHDDLVKRAMEKVSNVSFKIGKLKGKYTKKEKFYKNDNGDVCYSRRKRDKV